eukprot:403351881
MEQNSLLNITVNPNQPGQNRSQTSVLLQSDTTQTSQKHLISIEDFNLYEQNEVINSPKSLYACRLEGIFPKELLYKPLNKYEDKKKRLPPEVVKMRHDFFENKRLEMINVVKRSRQKIIDDLRHRMGSVSKFITGNTFENIGGSGQSKIFGNLGLNTKIGLATSRSQADISAMSRMGSVSQIDQAVQRDRELFQKQMEVAEKTKQKEAKMIEKIIRNEEAKNQKIEENQRKYEDLTFREKMRNRSIQRHLKEEAERKQQEEMN